MKQLFTLALALVPGLLNAAVGIPSTTTVYDRTAFEFPAGPTKQQGMDWTKRLYVGQPMQLFSAPVGTDGLVEEMQILIWTSVASSGVTGDTLDASMWRYPVITNLSKFKVNCAYDGHNYADWSCPLSVLFSYQFAHMGSNELYSFYTSSNKWGQVGELPINVFSTGFDTDFSAVLDGQKTNSFWQGSMKWPIPYTNGLRLWLTADVHFMGTNNGSEGCCSVYYRKPIWNGDPKRGLRMFANYKDQTGTGKAEETGALLGYATNEWWHLYGSNITGTHVIASNDVLLFLGGGQFSPYNQAVVTNVVGVSNIYWSAGAETLPSFYWQGAYGYSNITYKIMQPYVWLSRPAGKSGYLASILGGSLEAGVDYNPYVFINGEAAPTFVFPGTEDLYGASFGFKNIKQLLEYGCVAGLRWTNDLNFSPFAAYRHFRRNPIQYTNGIQGVLHMDNGVAHQWGVVWYEYPSAPTPAYNNAMALAYTNSLQISDTNKVKRVYLCFERLASAGLTNVTATTGGLVNGAFLGTNYNTNGFPLVSMFAAARDIVPMTNAPANCMTNVADGVFFNGFCGITNLLSTRITTNHTIMVVGSSAWCTNMIPFAVTGDKNPELNSSMGLFWDGTIYYTFSRGVTNGSPRYYPLYTMSANTNEFVAMWWGKQLESGMRQTNFLRDTICRMTNDVYDTMFTNQVKVAVCGGTLYGGNILTAWQGKISYYLIFNKVLTEWERKEAMISMRYLTKTGPVTYDECW